MSTPITTAAALELFCDPESIFEFKTKPFTIGGHVYATNGHWVVRFDPTAGQAHPTADPAWPFTTMAPELFAQAATRPWSDDAVATAGMALPPTAICPKCNGNGTILWEECAACYGNGCEECGGEGGRTSDVTGESLPCFSCDGGVDDKWTGVNVGQNYFSMVYLRELKAIPGCTFDPGQDREHGRFKFPLAEGGEAMGLLMPRERD